MSDADEMILAGSRPTARNPIDDLHSRTSTVILVDAIVLSWLLFAFTGLIQLALAPGVFAMFVWLGYRKRAAWAYWFGPMIMGGVTLIFSILLFLAINVSLHGWFSLNFHDADFSMGDLLFSSFCQNTLPSCLQDGLQWSFCL
jgi:succinate dehydrogenase hydrophobic anchor subunit